MKKIFAAVLMMTMMVSGAFARTVAQDQLEGRYNVTAQVMKNYANGSNNIELEADESYFSVAPFSVPEFENISNVQLNAFNFLVNNNYFKSVTVLGSNLVRTVTWDNVVEYLMVM